MGRFSRTWGRLLGWGGTDGSIRKPLVFRPSRTLVWTVVDHDPPPFSQALSNESTLRDELYWKSAQSRLAEPAPADSVSTLRRCCPPKRGFQPAPVNWAEVESTLGVRLPSDYRQLIDDRGAGVVAEVVVRAPGGSGGSLELGEWLASIGRTIASMRALTCGHFPPAMYPEPGGILPWGEVDGGHLVGWATTHPDPDRWPVVVLTPAWDELALHTVTATGYLLARLPGPDLKELAPSG